MPYPIESERDVAREHYIDECQRGCSELNDKYDANVREAIADDPDAVLAVGLVRFEFDDSRLDSDLEGDAWIVTVGDVQQYGASGAEVWCAAVDALRMAADCLARAD